MKGDVHLSLVMTHHGSVHQHTCSVRVESKTMLFDSGRGEFQTSLSTSASIDGTTIPVSGATVGALNAYEWKDHN